MKFEITNGGNFRIKAEHESDKFFLKEMAKKGKATLHYHSNEDFLAVLGEKRPPRKEGSRVVAISKARKNKSTMLDMYDDEQTQKEEEEAETSLAY